MSEIVAILVEWAKKKKRYPLLLLLLIPFIFSLIKNYFELSFKDVFGDWSFLGASGILFILSGGVYWAIKPRLKRLLLGGLFVLCGTILLAVSVWKCMPSPLPEGRLVVAIARFTPISPGAEDDAYNFSHRIEDKLNEKQHEGLPLEVKRLSKGVTGTNEQAREESAKELSIEADAHVILWGEIRKDEGELYVKPHLTIARQMQKVRFKDISEREFVNYEPNHIEFKERLAKGITDVVMLVYGLAYFEAQEWDRAIKILNYVDSKEGNFYRGLCMQEKAQQGVSPQKDFRNAVEIYERVIGPRPWNLTALEDDLIWKAYLNRANVITMLAFISQPKESLSFLQEAIEMYRTALQVRTRTKFSKDWASIQNNLGNALLNLGIHIGGEEGNKSLWEAVDAYRAALKVYQQVDLKLDWASAQNNLGAVVSELGKRVEGKEGNKLLWEAVDAHSAALQVRVRKKYRKDWACSQNNLGVVFRELGTRGNIKEGNKLLQDAIEAFQAALQVSTRGRFSQDWADTKNNLGIALCELGTRLDGEEGKRLIIKGVESFRDSLRVYRQFEFPQNWAGTKTNLGNALCILGERISGEEGVKYLDEAIDCYNKALTVFDVLNCPAYNKSTIANKSRAMLIRDSLRSIKH
ncbi:MAG TPA: hypothetical protein DEV73_03005 [Candidatus Zambryskibacteria bacterium]|uniref:Tetratricopeptide repeat protein n=1 Tax=Candidatus Gottesmanbacteria bacterium GW2011_GWC2_39_8 TaxID=1618450 RepID=A0A0G0Q610_9BACT|nr:MAG: hypothetical protein UT63_C0032G0007 [Candidatus Gottesmanbacteria bacterium GW2011_GWC2_39_8]HCH59555.1 hypothetical protein [Candidatus Zambryskibacteria bacterium]